MNSRLTIMLTALAAFAFGGGFAVGQSALLLTGTGTWNFSPNGLTNQGQADWQIRLKNTDSKGAWFHAVGNGPTGLGASRLTNDRSGPTVTFHKGRGDPDNMQPVLALDGLGSIQWSGTTDTGNITPGARLSARVIAPTPSDTDMETEVCILAVPSGSVQLQEVVCFSASEGMTFSKRGTRVVNSDGSLILKKVKRAELKPKTLAGSAVILDDIGRPRLAFSDGRVWRYSDGVLVGR